MGLLNKIFKKDEKKEIEQFKEKVEKAEQYEENLKKSKFDNRLCSACEQPGAEKKFGGQYWHKKCLRKMKKMAKGMV